VQEYLQFPYEYFLLVLLPSGVTVVNVVLQTTPGEKSQGLRSGKHAGQIPLLTIGKIYIPLPAGGAPVNKCKNFPV
jgi:hypothetical protein